MSAFGKRGGSERRTPELRRRQADEGRLRRPVLAAPESDGGEQFPPLEELSPPSDAPASDSRPAPRCGAMDRLTARQNASGDAASSKAEGFEASVHRIKEQVLPRLLERVDPEAAATLSKDELAEEFRPIIGEVLTELKINLNRREQFALEKVLVDELLGLGPLEELLADPAISDIMVNGPDQMLRRAQGQARARPDPVPRRGASVPDRPAHRQQGRPPRRPDHAARRRPPPGRQPRQRHRPAAVAARHRHLDS